MNGLRMTAVFLIAAGAIVLALAARDALAARTTHGLVDRIEAAAALADASRVDAVDALDRAMRARAATVADREAARAERTAAIERLPRRGVSEALHQAGEGGAPDLVRRKA